MFGTNFGKGGYNNYASQQNRVDTANAQQQKSARISDATKGKKKQRKPENKGKHRRVVKTKEQNVSLKDKNVGDVGLSVQFIRQKNKAGQGRPVSRPPVRGLSVAFPEAKKETETIAQAVAREIARARPNAPPPPPARRDADARAEVRRREVKGNKKETKIEQIEERENNRDN